MDDNYEQVEQAAKKLGDMVDFGRLDPPPELDEEALKGLERKEEMFEVTLGDKKLPTWTVQEMKKTGTPKLDVLLLHGAKFSSQDWLGIKTTSHLANWGYRAIAIDLPGMKNGKGKELKLEQTEYGPFLGAFITSMKMKNVVIVAPSASGGNTMPYLFDEPEKSTERAVGLVAVAPTTTQDYTKQFAKSQLQTLIVYGSSDLKGATTLNNLIKLPNHKIARIDGAGHACYLDKPDAFHKVLFHFLQEVKAS